MTAYERLDLLFQQNNGIVKTAQVLEIGIAKSTFYAYAKQRDNYLLAEDIYKVTSDRYREGIASMTEVLQDEMSMSDAQNNYLTAHFNYQVSNLTILKLTGQLDRLMK